LTSLVRWTLLTLAVGTIGCARADEHAAKAEGASGAAELVGQLASPDPAGRFVEASALFLGAPYANGPLGEGAGRDPDPDPRVDFERADCVTYLEQSLALALCPPDAPDRFLEVLDGIRYRGGEVDFAARNHYMVTDWIPANDRILSDVTSEVAAAAGVPTVSVTRTIDRARFLREQGASPRAGVDGVETTSVVVVPRAEASAVAPALRDGDLVFWVGNAEGIFVLHTGLVVRGPDGELSLRHASSKAERVLDEPFLAYAERSTYAIGYLVLRLNGSAAPGDRG
jgi:hypothetical protein